MSNQSSLPQSLLQQSQLDDLLRNNQRFHLFPKDRIEALATTSGLIGIFAGFYDGIQKTSNRYLVENGHRLPRTKGGWYFYHKRKNYELIVGGTTQAFKTGLKFSSIVGCFFLLEYGLDLARGQIDFLNTTAAAALGSTIYTRYKQLSYIQSRKIIIGGTLSGVVLGIIQDLLINARNGNVWYISEYKRRFHVNK
ncbi:uncharacterized protein KGF55_000259 [Candida pseudojiufengensis]|uniref:uncharacterized protein n=1 Tax=Candida pseudojiufengensis TaxID=497109 RepID=UPI002225150A|nr:uncharacterized protein KGF55_000259 [Candida pseudojiufengensis]KAI5966850.1 hypothetical protein KGF55_000259 [Candida pseudojiufengensis]